MEMGMRLDFIFYFAHAYALNLFHLEKITLFSRKKFDFLMTILHAS